MTQLLHLNGPPGIGKSTLSALYAQRHPGVLNLDVDAVHRLIGGWQDEENRTWQVVWPLVRAMAATQLQAGRDVVLPQYHARLEEITALEALAGEHGAAFREVVLIDDRQNSIERFDRRGRESDDEWIQYHHQAVGERGGDEGARASQAPRRRGAERTGSRPLAGPVLLGTMYDDLLELVRLLPAAVVVRSTAGAVQETYELLLGALPAPGS